MCFPSSNNSSFTINSKNQAKTHKTAWNNSIYFILHSREIHYHLAYIWNSDSATCSGSVWSLSYISTSSTRLSLSVDWDPIIFSYDPPPFPPTFPFIFTITLRGRGRSSFSFHLQNAILWKQTASRTYSRCGDDAQMALFLLYVLYKGDILTWHAVCCDCIDRCFLPSQAWLVLLIHWCE